MCKIFLSGETRGIRLTVTDGFEEKQPSPPAPLPSEWARGSFCLFDLPGVALPLVAYPGLFSGRPPGASEIDDGSGVGGHLFDLFGRDADGAVYWDSGAG